MKNVNWGALKGGHRVGNVQLSGALVLEGDPMAGETDGIWLLDDFQLEPNSLTYADTNMPAPDPFKVNRWEDRPYNCRAVLTLCGGNVRVPTQTMRVEFHSAKGGAVFIFTVKPGSLRFAKQETATREQISLYHRCQALCGSIQTVKEATRPVFTRAHFDIVWRPEEEFDALYEGDWKSGKFRAAFVEKGELFAFWIEHADPAQCQLMVRDLEHYRGENANRRQEKREWILEQARDVFARLLLGDIEAVRETK